MTILDRRRDAIEKKLKSMYGMDPENKRLLNLELSRKDDWFTVCKFCRKRISGTHKDIQDHVEICMKEKENETSQ